MGVIEAMAWGVPVVAWNHAGPTVTVVDGVTGYLAEPYRVGAYGSAIAWLLQDPELRSRMGQAGRERAERYFSWDRHIQTLDRSVRSAVGESAELTAPVPVPVFGRNGSTPVVAHQPVAVAELAEMETAPLRRG